MKILVTGCNGFVGKHLCNSCRKNGDAVFGIDLQDETTIPNITYKKTDIADYSQLEKFLDLWGIENIFHLAALANPRAAQASPQMAVRINVLGTSNLYEYCRTHPQTKLLVVGSSEQYKVKSSQRIVFSEEDELSSHNIYGASKIASEIIGKEYARQYGSKIYFTRSFNHTGPGQAAVYVLAEFAKQCAEIKREKREPEIHVGNIEVARDFLDVRDVISAYEKILFSGQAGETYNVCSGSAYKLKDLLDTLLTLTGRSDIRIVVDKEKLRKDEPLEILGNPDKIKKDTSWIPLIPIGDTLKELFEYWQAAV